MPREVDAVLEAFGLPVAPGQMARTPDEAVAFADDYGYPVVVKLASDTIVHKSDWDGVKVNLETAEAVRAACQGIGTKLEGANRLDELDGFLVQPMIRRRGRAGGRHDRRPGVRPP